MSLEHIVEHIPMFAFPLYEEVDVCFFCDNKKDVYNIVSTIMILIFSNSIHIHVRLNV